MIRVMVVDDQPVVRAGFAAIVDAEDDLEVVGEAADGGAALELAARVAPDVVLMDIRMPGMDGLTATARLTGAAQPTGGAQPTGTGGGGSARPDGAGGGGPKVLVLTTFGQDAYVYEALRAGASGFLLKDAQPADLLAAIRIVADGEAMLSPSVTRRLIDAFAAGGAVPATTEPDPRLAGLTPRERQVLMSLATGLSNAEIGIALGVATGTVKAHVNALLAKLGVRDRVQATIVAYDLGLVRPR